MYFVLFHVVLWISYDQDLANTRVPLQARDYHAATKSAQVSLCSVNGKKRSGRGHFTKLGSCETKF